VKIGFPRLAALLVLVGLGAAAALVDSGPASAASWYSTSWAYRKSITISHNKIPATQSNFPVLIDLSSDSDLASNAQSSGNDILFTSADGVTKLNHEIEKYSSSTGALTVWVKVPSASGSTDTVLYMYYGNPSASNQQNASGVWDSNYGGVWHLPNGSSLSLADSTTNGRTGTNHGATATSGKIDGGATFGGSQYVSLPSTTLSSGNFTVSLWFKTTSRGVLFSEQNVAIGSTPTSWDPMLYVDTNGKLEGGIYTGNTPGITSSSAVNNGSWHFAVLTVNASGTTQTLYLDGSTVGSWSGTPEGPFSYVSIGAGYANNWPNTPSSSTSYFNGQIDDVRVSSSATARSANWISTEWNDQNSPSTFYSVGSAETLDTTPPNAFSITSPSSGATVSNGQTISSSPTDNVSVASVDYRYCPGSSCTYSSGTEIDTASSGPPFSVTWSSQPSNGSYTLIARAFDGAGNHTDSSTTTVTVSNAPASSGASSTGGANVSSLSWSHTVDNQANRVLVIGVTAEYSSGSNCQATSVKYGGTALTRIDQSSAVSSSIYQCVSLWYLVAPTVGTATVSVTFPVTLDGATAGAVNLYSVKQGAPDASNTNYSNSGATSTNVTTLAANSTVVDVFGSGQSLGDLGPGSGQTAQWTQDSGNSNSGGSSTETATSPHSVNMSWTQTGINRSAQVAAAFAPISPCNGGSLGLNAPSSISFPAKTLSGTNLTASASLQLTPDDETANGAGWNITGTSTTLKNGSSRTLPTAATTVTAASASAGTGNCSLPTNSISYPLTLPAASTPPAGVRLYNAAANSGAGPSNVNLTFQVSIPANAYQGTYTSTWTFAIVSGP
jgi:Concanavalin A-like lectin/glucanases superfamily/Domain of unknown function (DUF2341)